MAVTYVSAVDRKEQLINATIAVLQKSGIKGVTTRSVAAEANAPLASIHYTFGSLDDLVLAAFERLIEEVNAWVVDGLDVKAGYGPCIIGIMERVAGLLEDERYGVLLHDLNPTGDRRVEILEEKYYRLAQDLIDLIADAVGHAVLEQLRLIDEVAYMRFASVYKNFDDAADFKRELALLEKHASTSRA